MARTRSQVDVRPGGTETAGAMSSLLERHVELEALDRVVRGLDAGTGRLVLLAGEAGIGKSSLVRELRRRSADVPVLVAACEPLSVPVPLAPLRELFLAAGAPDPVEAPDRLTLARTLLETLAGRAPLVAVLEDVHWADPLTLDVVRLVGRRLEGTRLALVLTYRDDEIEANPHLQRLVGDLAADPHVERLAPRPLSEAAVGELAAPAGIDPAELARLTAGNPFLVVEAVAAKEHLPQTVREAALARVSRLSPPARAAVEAAAVFGRRVSPRLLEAVAPGSAAGADEALGRGVLVADAEALSFRHELMREALEQSLPPARRAALHERVVAALEAQQGEPDHALVAHHAERAGLAEAAAQHARLAADEAERMGALQEAALQAQRALRLATSLTQLERFDLLVRHSRYANFASTRLEDAIESATAAESLADELGNRLLEGRAQLALASALWSADDVTGARDTVERAVRSLEVAEDREQTARAYALQIRVEATTFDPRRAIELAQSARALAEASGQAESIIDVEISAALALGHLGASEAHALLERAAREARDARLTIQTVRVYVNLVYVAMLHRRHESVDAWCAEALDLFDDFGAAIPANAVQLYRARSLLDRGRFAEARTVAELPNRNWAAEAPFAHSIRGLIAARTGEPGATEILEHAWSSVRDLPENTRHGMIRVALVEAAWLRGDRVEAISRLEAAGEPPFARPAGDLAVWRQRLGLHANAPENAPQPVLDELAGDWRGASRGWQLLGAPYEAALAALRGDERAAREAVAQLRRLGAGATVTAFARDRKASGGRGVRGPRRSTAAHPAGLTRREQEVLEALASGATNAAIGSALHLSERTVAHHVSSVLRKLEVPTRAAAIRAAQARNLLPKDGPPARKDGPN